MGVLMGGELLRGPSSSATEWGHTRVVVGGRRCECGGRGCLQAYIGSDAIITRWREAGGDPLGDGWQALGELVQRSSDGDDAARRVVDETIEILGAGLGSAVNLFAPDRVVIGGWVGLRLMEQHAAPIERAVRSIPLGRFQQQFSVRTCAFGGDSVALGAALLPLGRLLDAPADAPPSVWSPVHGLSPLAAR